MKQAIQEGFILDVLQNYTSIQSYFNLIKKIDEDPEFDSKRAQRRLRHYVEGHENAIRAKAEHPGRPLQRVGLRPATAGRQGQGDGRDRRCGPRHRLPFGHQ